MKKSKGFLHNSKRIFIFILSFFVALQSSSLIIAHASENSINTGTTYKNLLTSDEKEVYDQVYSALLEHNESLFSMTTPLSEADLEDTMNAIFNDHPELYWANTSYKYAVDSSGIVHKIMLSYGISQSEMDNVKRNFNSVVASLVSGASKYSTDLEKEKYLHDTICSMNTYSVSSSMNQSAYSALTSGYSVCAGYARAFQIVCLESGIPCYYVTGTSKGETHAWNIVQIDGKYYNVDLTWDDCLSELTGNNSYCYFNKNDLEFSRDHSRSILSSQLMACN